MCCIDERRGPGGAVPGGRRSGEEARAGDSQNLVAAACCNRRRANARQRSRGVAAGFRRQDEWSAQQKNLSALLRRVVSSRACQNGKAILTEASSRPRIVGQRRQLDLIVLTEGRGIKSSKEVRRTT